MKLYDCSKISLLLLGFVVGLAGRRVDLYEDKKIDFKDFAELAAWWLNGDLWP